jgi:hypothetical protein
MVGIEVTAVVAWADASSTCGGGAIWVNCAIETCAMVVVDSFSRERVELVVLVFSAAAAVAAAGFPIVCCTC